MSREERKMAQIVATIERMEQETRASEDDSSRTQEAPYSAKQGLRGKKGKKGKLLGGKVKAGKKTKAAAVVAGARTQFECKMTPQKRWIQLWSAQMEHASNLLEAPCDARKARSHSAAVAESSGVSVDNATVCASPARTSLVEPEVGILKSFDKTNAMPSVGQIPVTMRLGEYEPPFSECVRKVSKLQQPSENREAEVPQANPSTKSVTFSKELIAPKALCATVTSSSELRVKTPKIIELSHLSPPVERSSPTITSSISPSAKVKDSGLQNSNTASAAATAAKFSPTISEHERFVTTKKDFSRLTPLLRLEENSSSRSVDRGSESDRMSSSGGTDLVRKRGLERVESSMSEDAKRRAERRRKRKSNWDVGDPRKGGNPIADPPLSAAAAAANQQSFAKYPSSRPSWRPPLSTLDIKPSLQCPQRSSTSHINTSSTTSRKSSFHSLSQDRSRSTGRLSVRHSSSVNPSDTQSSGCEGRNIYDTRLMCRK
ncbi:uncharacterized protein CCR75_008949 [Bremia lactucae]|uniref:Uncharacterized protein n=1 Tax=Bremia lactucae TaxID=4779 RepID=A0A976FR30_BRELC|nr:hypothetical protein CCR75_008949 [Bremia lactucae]